MGRRLVGTGLCLAVVLGGTFGLEGRRGAPEARADEPAATPAAPAAPAAAKPDVVAASGCKIQGTQPGRKGVQIFDAMTGGRVIASFTGALVPMTMSAIPLDPTQARAKLSTSAGSPALRLDGYVGVSDVTVFTTRDIPVVASHVWITSGQRVKIVAATADTLRAELTVGGTESQKARSSAPCEAFSLQPVTPSAMEIPGNGRGYMTKSTALDLYDRPNGDVIFTLKMIEGAGQLFWSTETRAGFVHVQSRGDISVDAWARWRDLAPLKKGEMQDQFIPPSTSFAGAKLALDKPPPVVKATREIPIRARRDDKEKPVGVVEPGAEVYVMETIAGWTNILPVSLGVTPPDEGGFWVPAAEAPK